VQITSLFWLLKKKPLHPVFCEIVSSNLGGNQTALVILEKPIFFQVKNCYTYLHREREARALAYF